MPRYRNNPDAIRALVRPREVHRDVYLDDEVFDLEMEHLFHNTWNYVGHASQVPQKGDYLGAEVGLQPLIISRHSDMSIHVFYNRCPHKGVRVTTEPCGNTGKFFRCPYHAWSFKTNGELLAVPLKKGYEGTGLEDMPAYRGLYPVKNVKVYRDFIFVRLSEEGLSFEEFFGESLSTIDNMIDRSPEGKLVVEGEPLRYMHPCNWKMLVENQTDTCHPMVAHESSAGTAIEIAKRDGIAKHPGIELLAPFMSSYEFFEGMGIRVWPNGHGHTGVSNSIHAAYSEIPGYWEAMEAAYGAERAKAILGEVRHNTVYFPNIMVKGPIQNMRIFKPIAANKTLVESWTFRMVGAPDQLFARTLMYNRFINAPTSVVGHDDLEMYERAQIGLRAEGNEWVNVQRLYDENEEMDVTEVVNGTSEKQMRNQFHAWVKFMTQTMAPAAVAAE
jgi:phenylpropionate dioxygenase-like ring-hydroxylating dioxygenase large terminal subunit